MATEQEKGRWEDTFDYRVVEVNGEHDHDHIFTILCNCKRFIVTVHPSGPQIQALISSLSKALLEDEEDPIQEAQDAIEDLIYATGWRKFIRLAPNNDQATAKGSMNLHSVLHPKTYYFSLIEDGGEIFLSQQSPSPQPILRPFRLAINDVTLSLDLPRYSTNEIFPIRTFPGLSYMAQVSVRGQEMFCKVGKVNREMNVQREYECLQKIALSRYASSIMAPRLIGLVVDGDGDDVNQDDDNGGTNVIGILEEYIPHEDSLGKLAEGEDSITSIALERREKWAEQITQSVDLLHQIGVVWGDGKPDNILIHTESDVCYLIDFGGSYTNGWVEYKLMDTRDGDTQAVERILGFLGIIA